MTGDNKPLNEGIDLNNISDDDLNHEDNPDQDTQEDEQQQAAESTKKETSENKEENTPTLEELVKNVENLQARYKGSSEEGKRLASENKDLKAKLEEVGDLVKHREIINQIVEHPEIAEYARKVLSGQQQNTVEIPENHELDFEEAVRNPNSVSGKVLSQLIDRASTDKLNAYKKEQSGKDQEREYKAGINRQINQVRDKYGFDEETVEEALSWINNNKIGVEDHFLLWAMKNNIELNSKEPKKVNKPQDELDSTLSQLKQLLKNENLPPNASQSGDSEGLSFGDKLWEEMKKENSSTINDLI